MIVLCWIAGPAALIVHPPPPPSTADMHYFCFIPLFNAPHSLSLPFLPPLVPYPRSLFLCSSSFRPISPTLLPLPPITLHSPASKSAAPAHQKRQDQALHPQPSSHLHHQAHPIHPLLWSEASMVVAPALGSQCQRAKQPRQTAAPHGTPTCVTGLNTRWSSRCCCRCSC